VTLRADLREGAAEVRRRVEQGDDVEEALLERDAARVAEECCRQLAE
jgi:hypothetical protein